MHCVIVIQSFCNAKCFGIVEYIRKQCIFAVFSDALKVIQTNKMGKIFTYNIF